MLYLENENIEWQLHRELFSKEYGYLLKSKQNSKLHKNKTAHIAFPSIIRHCCVLTHLAPPSFQWNVPLLLCVCVCVCMCVCVCVCV